MSVFPLFLPFMAGWDNVKTVCCPCSLKGVYEGDRDRMMLASVVTEGEVHMQDVVMFHDRLSSNYGRLIADGGMLEEV